MSMVVKRAEFVLEAGELKCFERTADSGRKIRSHFCSECGTRIYTEPNYGADLVNVKPGTLDDTSGLSPNIHVWTQSRQRWFELPQDVRKVERQPV